MRPLATSMKMIGVSSRITGKAITANMPRAAGGFHQRNRGARKNSWYSRCATGSADGFGGGPAWYPGGNGTAG
ncbi:MAG: hypothetical protein QM736_22025 [Vicinamibacterales bacterium]